MKPRFTLALSSLAALTTLAGCGNSSSNLPPFGVETIRQSELLIPNKKGEASPSGLAFDLLFKAKSEIPYISLKDGFGFLNFVKAARLSDPKNEKYFYRLTGEGNRFVVTTENGASATFDVAAQTVAYSDFENFVALPPSPEAKPLALYSPTPKVKAIALTKSEFKKGKDVTVALKSYEGVDLYLREGVPYLPLATFNDMFYNIFEYSNLAYNYKDVYLATDNAFMSRLGGLPVLTAYGESFFSGPKKETVSEELRQFNYAEACLNFDNFYGLKKDKGFSSFASFIEEKGFKGDFFSADTKKADAALRLASSHLIDGHTAGTLTSPLYAFGEATDDETRANQQKAKWLSGSERLQASRGNGEAALGNSLDATGGVYYIAFNDFTANDEDLMYTPKDLLNPDAIKSSTALQFNDAYTFLTDPANKGKAKTIVVDLSTNDGGSADALVFGLCTLLGEVKSTCISPITGAENHSSYKADINLDGKIDEKDVPLCKDYNIVFLNSIYTFSSGNAMPAIAKDNNAKVMTIGETSGGGACIVRPVFTPLASGMYLSGLQAIATEKDGKLVHVDKGVPADHAIEQNNMFSRSFISTMVNGWLEEK